MKIFAAAVALLGSSLLCQAAPAATNGEPILSGQELALQMYGRQPLSFTVNAGQADGTVAFLAQGSGYSVILSRTKAEMTQVEWNEARGHWPPSRGSSVPKAAREDVLRLTFDGASNPQAVEGAEEQGGEK